MGSCAQPKFPLTSPAPLSLYPWDGCRYFYAELDHEVNIAGVADAQYHRIKGYPSLRSSRFLASFTQELNTETQFQTWLRNLEQLDRDARHFEWANLSAITRKRLRSKYDLMWRSVVVSPYSSDLDTLLRYCQKHSSITNTPTLRAAAQVPPDYQRWKRLVGLYYISALPVIAGVRREEAKVHHYFAIPQKQLPTEGQPIRYSPAFATTSLPLELVQPSANSHLAALTPSLNPTDHPLAIPQPSPKVLAALFQHFAPIWVVDTLTKEDQIGRPFWPLEATVPEVDVKQPVVYTHTTYTRWGDSTLLQLNYTIWFPARPARSRWDILAGKLDGINWRVTLDKEATVLLYDIIHNCGCYHWFFPSKRLQPRPAPNTWEEWALIPQLAPTTLAGERIALQLSHTGHTLQRVYSLRPDRTTNRTYTLKPYHHLRSLPVSDGGKRSLFKPNGLVAGTERLERWLLWPMGIDSPGAMRQKGRHATAFVGRRHYDDARLLERYFLLQKPLP